MTVIKDNEIHIIIWRFMLIVHQSSPGLYIMHVENMETKIYLDILISYLIWSQGMDVLSEDNIRKYKSTYWHI